ncbi:MAG: acetolactate synthase small subunit [Oceanococcaceae bacterium]
MRHIISILLANESGALSRVAGLFSARGYNIESLTVAPTQDPTVSRLTMVTAGPDDVIDQINKQLPKLVDVVDLADLTEGAHIEREVALIKLELDADAVPAMAALVRTLGGQVLDDSPNSYTIEMAGAVGEVDDAIGRFTHNARLLELVRSGAAAIATGPTALQTP